MSIHKICIIIIKIKYFSNTFNVTFCSFFIFFSAVSRKQIGQNSQLIVVTYNGKEQLTAKKSISQVISSKMFIQINKTEPLSHISRCSILEKPVKHAVNEYRICCEDIREIVLKHSVIGKCFFIINATLMFIIQHLNFDIQFVVASLW